jgi:hypothetical protein
MSAALLTSVELESLERQVLVSKPELLTPPVRCESELDPCHYVVGKLFTCQSFTLLVSGRNEWHWPQRAASGTEYTNLGKSPCPEPGTVVPRAFPSG